jgi:hypothetical protein
MCIFKVLRSSACFHNAHFFAFALLLALFVSSTCAQSAALAAAPVEFLRFSSDTPSSGTRKAWVLEAKALREITASAFNVQVRYLNRQGAVQFNGEDIPLPATASGRTLRLSGSYEPRPDISAAAFSVIQRVDGKTLLSQSFPIAGALSGPSGQGRPRPGALPQSTPSAAPDGPTKPTLSILPERENRGFCIVNDSQIDAALDQIIVTYRFLAGIDGKDPQERLRVPLKPGGKWCHELQPSRYECAALSAVDVDFRLNGNPTHLRALSFETPLRMLARPAIGLDKYFQAAKDMDSFASAYVTFTGEHIRPGTRLLVKAWAQVDNSDRFPVVFDGVQEKNQIVAKTFIAGTRTDRAPERVCLHVLEVTTDDRLHCGGVGLLLYRAPEIEQGRFLLEKFCK